MRSERGVAAFAAALALAACGGVQEQADAPVDAPTAPDIVEAGPYGTLRYDAQAHRVVVEGYLGAGEGESVALAPAGWTDDLVPPVIGLGAVHRDGDAFLLERWTPQLDDPDEVVILPPDADAVTDGLKLDCAATAVDGNFVDIDCGVERGVTDGDFYYALTRAPGPERRFGERVGALIRIIESDDETSRGRILHRRADVTPGALLVFAQASFDLPDRRATIRVAPFTPGGDAEEGFPAIANALPEYLGRFGLSNIGVDVAPEYVDPRPADAADAVDDLPFDDFGCFVFGLVEDGTFYFNAAPYGNLPHPASTVGILPGGLPLPITSSVDELSSQLVPSFLAMVMATRGDHALAAYFLENVLADEELEPGVRFHLREHLALRYEAIGFEEEALALMNHDIAQAERIDDAYALMNALSIRGSLLLRAGRDDAGAAGDYQRFIEVAEGRLPESDLYDERVGVAYALAQVDLDAAVDIGNEVLEIARDEGDAHVALSAAFLLATILEEQPAAARLALSDIDLESDAYTDETKARVEALLAMRASEMDDDRGALQLATSAMERIAESESLAAKANVYLRVARVHHAAGNLYETVAIYQEAAALLLETGQIYWAGHVLTSLAFAELEFARTDVGPAVAVELLQRARRNLLLGSELLLRLGRSSEGARAMVWAGEMEQGLNEMDIASRLLARATRFAFASGNAEVAFEAAVASRAFFEANGPATEAETFAAFAVEFAEVAGIDYQPEVVEAPSE